MSEVKEYSLTELNKPADWNNLPGMAKKHLPVIEAPNEVNANDAFSVRISVGGIDGVVHPNTLTHWINWVEVYAEEQLICRIEFGSELSNGYSATINVTLSKTATLNAKAYCNMHGVWQGKSKKVSVK